MSGPAPGAHNVSQAARAPDNRRSFAALSAGLGVAGVLVACSQTLNTYKFTGTKPSTCGIFQCTGTSEWLRVEPVGIMIAAGLAGLVLLAGSSASVQRMASGALIAFGLLITTSFLGWFNVAFGARQPGLSVTVGAGIWIGAAGGLFLLAAGVQGALASGGDNDELR